MRIAMTLSCSRTASLSQRYAHCRFCVPACLYLTSLASGACGYQYALSQIQRLVLRAQDSDVMRLAQGIGALESSAKSGSLQEAKKSFVTAVSALQTWAESAGIAASLKGL